MDCWWCQEAAGEETADGERKKEEPYELVDRPICPGESVDACVTLLAGAKRGGGGTTARGVKGDGEQVVGHAAGGDDGTRAMEIDAWTTSFSFSAIFSRGFSFVGQ